MSKADRACSTRCSTIPAALRANVSNADQRRLDEYLSSVREVEQRIESAGKAGRLQGWRPTLAKPDMPRPADGIPQDIDQHMRLMCDILVLAFRTDATRVATLKLNNDHSSLRFPHLKVDYMIHHLLSHTDNADWLKVNQFFTQQVAYIAEKLDAVQEGDRTLLDNSMILFCSSMMTGSHNNDQLPVVLLGRGGGQIKTGRVLDYLGKPNRRMCSLYLSLMDKAGVHLNEFGDSRERAVGYLISQSPTAEICKWRLLNAPRSANREPRGVFVVSFGVPNRFVKEWRRAMRRNDNDETPVFSNR